jgi:hypothetical protein
MYEVFCVLILMSALTEMVQTQSVWPATGCSDVTLKLSSCQNTRLSTHEWIGILGLEHLNEINIYQHECPKNGRLKQHWLQHTLLSNSLPTQWKAIPDGKTYLVLTHFLAIQIWILYIFLEDVSLVCCFQHSKTFLILFLHHSSHYALYVWTITILVQYI